MGKEEASKLLVQMKHGELAKDFMIIAESYNEKQKMRKVEKCPNVIYFNTYFHRRHPSTLPKVCSLY